jgi:GT2 family glycosyltransferase
MRNHAAREAQARVLIFLDADMELTPDWSKRLPHALSVIRDSPQTILGSRPALPPSASWLEHFWFTPVIHDPRPVRYVGAAHLLIDRSWFHALNGFDASKTTGEDPDLCARAIAKGSCVVNDPKMKVIHHGYPKDLTSFVRRERWHATGDWENWPTACRSMVVHATVVFAFLHLALISSLLFPVTILIAPALVLLLALLLFISTLRRFGATIESLLTRSFIFYFYYVGRLWGAVATLFSSARSNTR